MTTRAHAKNLDNSKQAHTRDRSKPSLQIYNGSSRLRKIRTSSCCSSEALQVRHDKCKGAPSTTKEAASEPCEHTRAKQILCNFTPESPKAEFNIEPTAAKPPRKVLDRIRNRCTWHSIPTAGSQWRSCLGEARLTCKLAAALPPQVLVHRTVDRGC